MLERWIVCGKLLARGGGLTHDIGKATLRFAAKLRAEEAAADDVRHEWLSMKLLQALRRNGWDWAGAWKSLRRKLHVLTLGDREICARSPLGVENPIEAIDLLVVTHHGLLQCQQGSRAPTPLCPTARDRHIRTDHPAEPQLTPCGSVVESIWVQYRAVEATLCETIGADGSRQFWRALTLLARAALIAADHAVSRMRMPLPGDGSLVYANTADFKGCRRLNQPLDWHLQNVGERAEQLFEPFAACVSSAGAQPLPGLTDQIRATILSSASSAGRFRWQNFASDALVSARAEKRDAPCLVFSLAGTGAGKTRMNLRAACALSRDTSPRVSIALNLRSLTLQTGRALRTSLGLTAEQLAVVIGDVVTRSLFERSHVDEDENPGEPEVQVDGVANRPLAWLHDIAPKLDEQKLLQTPVLVSTIDYLIAAGEPAYQGHHVRALLRVLSSDLVLDEVDSYEPEALVAVLRIIEWAAMAGRNVVCSSATLSEPTAHAVHGAFRSGVGLRQALLERKVRYQCAVIDDLLPPELQCFSVDGAGFGKWYADRLAQLKVKLAAAPVYRLAALQPVPEISVKGWMKAVSAGVQQLHESHAWRFGDTGKRVSFGLVRVANIGTAVDTARFLAAAMPHAWVACYHAGEFLIARFNKERCLDALLVRSGGDQHIVDSPEIRSLVERSEATDVPFILVATPIEEIGRDHDFDWGVLDASSAQSLVQAAGRINRHRLLLCNGRPNILVLQFNWRHCKNEGRLSTPVFVWPGYQKVGPGNSSSYGNHDLAGLLPWSDGLLVINASVRFDSGCQLAMADDRAIAQRIAPFYGDRGAFISTECHSWLLTQGECSPYDYTQLRDSKGEQQTWRVKNTTPATFARRERVLASQGVIRDTWMPESMPTLPAALNAWLTCGPAAMEQLCSEFGIPPTQGMVVVLTNYSRTGKAEFVCDWGFGVSRKRPS